MFLICIAGLIGSGKDEAARYLSARHGYTLLDHSALMGEILRRKGRPQTREEKRRLRQERGNSFTAEEINRQIRKRRLRKVVVGSLRRPEEFDIARRDFPSAKLLVIEAAPRIRFERLLKRGRDAPRGWRDFVQTDKEEERIFQFSRTFRMADARVDNSGSLDGLRARLDAVIQAIEAGKL